MTHESPCGNAEGTGEGRQTPALLLIYPPCTKACEPPAGIAKLAGALAQHGAPYQLLDANLEGMLALAAQPRGLSDTWTRRAVNARERNLASLRGLEGYVSADRYSRAVRDLERLVSTAPGHATSTAADGHFVVSLANLTHTRLSAVSSRDLVVAAQSPEINPFYSYFSERLPGLVEQLEPRVVGFSLMYLSQALTTFAMIGFLRERFSGLRIVVGGGLVTSWQTRVDLHQKFTGLVDQFVSGPGEETVLELSVATSRTTNSVGTPEIDAHAASRPRRCPPCYDGLPHSEYLAPGFILPFAISVGCWWRRCSFCPENAEESRYSALPVELVREQLAALISKHRPVLVHFTDNALPPSLLRSLAREPLGVPWYGFVRVSRDLADSEFCRSLSSSGCIMLKLGVESGSDAVLDAMNKGFATDLCGSVLQALRSANIATYVYLLFGTPSETLQNAHETLQFVASHAECVTYLNLAVFNLPTHGPDAAELQTTQFYEGDLSLYTDFIHPTGFDRRQVKLFIERDFRAHPQIGPILRRDPHIFSSNHAPLFELARSKTRPGSSPLVELP